jgi:hypothetical protein
MIELPNAYCVIRNNRQPFSPARFAFHRDPRRRVETGLLTAIAIRGRPVKGLSLADPIARSRVSAGLTPAAHVVPCDHRVAAATFSST